MKIVEMTEDFIFFEAPHNTVSHMATVYSKVKGTHRVPNTLGSLRDLHLAGFDVKDAGTAKANERQALLMEKRFEAVNTDIRLRPYQKQDVNFLIQKDSGASFSEMRTGKTPTMIQVLEKRNVPSIVVVPSSLTHMWVDEIHKWSTMDAVTTGNMTPSARKKLYYRFSIGEINVLVISKGIASMDVAELEALGAQMMVIDEAHFLRNYKTNQSNAMYRLGKNMKYRYALTGTPATNKPDDLYGILKYLQPSKYPSYWQFVERYFVIADSPFGKKIGDFVTPLRKKEFHELVEEISVQRKRKDVMDWLQGKQYQTIKLEMGNKQAKAYKQMKGQFEIEESDISAPSVLAQLTRLRQLTVAPSMLDLDIPSVKEEFILEWLENNPTEQVVIFSNFTSYLKQLHMRLNQGDLITGETPQEHRKLIVDGFQAGKFKVLLANIQAAGVGLTLDKAGVVIFLDRAYTPTENDQAEDRIVATTKESNQEALIIDLVCKGTVDEKIIKMVKEKKNITQIVNDYKSFREVLG